MNNKQQLLEKLWNYEINGDELHQLETLLWSEYDVIFEKWHDGYNQIYQEELDKVGEEINFFHLAELSLLEEMTQEERKKWVLDSPEQINEVFKAVKEDFTY